MNQGDRGVYIQTTEHSGTVHSYSPHSGPMPGYGEEAGIVDIDEVVGSGESGINRQAGGGGGGGGG